MDSPKITEDHDEVDRSSEETLQFLNHLSLERRLSDHTVRNYNGALQKFLLWLGSELKELQILDTDKKIARSYLVDCQQNLSRKTLANQVSALRCFFHFCQTRGWIKSNPFKNLSLPKPEKASRNF